MTNNKESTAVIDRLIEDHSEKAYVTAFRLTGNQADACDLVQETFLRIMKKAELYDAAFDLGGWLHRVLFRVYLNSRRANERRREVSLEPAYGDDGSAAEYKTDPNESPEKIMENNELRDRISEALGTLSPDMRACVVLVDIEGYNYEQAAEALGWPVGSVSGRLFRARHILRDILKQAEGEHI
ncbi:MAG: RNA polymerase sigma factor [Elusimicrobiota bacterium]